MANQDDDLFKGRISGKGKKNGKIPSLPSGRKEQIVKDSKSVQAVVKVTSFRHGFKQVLESAQYISRDGDLGLENENGEFTTDPDEIKDQLQEWADDFDQSKKSRDVANIVLSAPAGSDLDATTAASRDFAREYFDGNNRYMFAVHNDQDHPHVHLMVSMRGLDGEKLTLRKRELHDMRKLFAEKLTEQGIEASASYRSERGVTHKSEKQWKAQMKKKRGATPDNVKKGVKEVIAELHKEGEYKTRDFEKTIISNHRKVAGEYAETAKELKEEGNLEAAQEVENALGEMKKPITKGRETAIKYQAQRDKAKVNLPKQKTDQEPSR